VNRIEVLVKPAEEASLQRAARATASLRLTLPEDAESDAAPLARGSRT